MIYIDLDSCTEDEIQCKDIDTRDSYETEEKDIENSCNSETDVDDESARDCCDINISARVKPRWFQFTGTPDVQTKTYIYIYIWDVSWS